MDEDLKKLKYEKIEDYNIAKINLEKIITNGKNLVSVFSMGNDDSHENIETEVVRAIFNSMSIYETFSI